MPAWTHNINKSSNDKNTNIGIGPSIRTANALDYTPIEWSEFYAHCDDIRIDEARVFRVFRTKEAGADGVVFLLLHGFGCSALSWALFSREITNMMPCQCLAVDLRGHGSTVTSNDKDLSIATLTQDMEDLMNTIYDAHLKPPIYIIGHSLGGVIAVHYAGKAQRHNIIGLTVIDVVEGTALASLPQMHRLLRTRPLTFETIPDAIKWCVQNGVILNLQSARISVPAQIVNRVTKMLAASELCLKGMANEEVVSSQYTWRINPAESQNFWYDWFAELSEKFLKIKLPKQLVLANINCMDKTLTIGHMQGKFQLQVVTNCGHAVHEDKPQELAKLIVNYLIRNQRPLQ